MVPLLLTAFTRLTGAIPRTVNDLFSSPAVPQLDVKPITESDKEVVETLKFIVTDLCDWHQECRDIAHRSSLFSKLVNDTSMCVADFYMLPGGMVSYQGERWKLVEVFDPPNQPITAKIQQATHADAVRTKHVRYDTLQNLSAAREKLDVTVEDRRLYPTFPTGSLFRTPPVPCAFLVIRALALPSAKFPGCRTQIPRPRRRHLVHEFSGFKFVLQKR